MPSFTKCLLALVVEQISNNDCGVINHLLLSHPPNARLLYKDINTLCWTLLGFCHVNRLLVVHELPKTIRCNNKELVRGRVEIKLGKLWVRDDTGSVRDTVSKRSV